MKIVGFSLSLLGCSAWAVCSGIAKLGRVNRARGLRKRFCPPRRRAGRRIRATRKRWRIRAGRHNRHARLVANGTCCLLFARAVGRFANYSDDPSSPFARKKSSTSATPCSGVCPVASKVTSGAGGGS